MIEGENALAPLRDLARSASRSPSTTLAAGYSTLASLVRFPVHTLKLDRALIRDIDSNPDAARVVRAVIRMAHDLGRRVVAEGVDNFAALRFLREAECDEAQGFLLAKPMPAASSAACSRPGARRNARALAPLTQARSVTLSRAWLSALRGLFHDHAEVHPRSAELRADRIFLLSKQRRELLTRQAGGALARVRACSHVLGDSASSPVAAGVAAAAVRRRPASASWRDRARAGPP